MFPKTWFKRGAATVLLASSMAVAAEPAAIQAPSAFFLSRSENRNQVHYAVSLDESCRPVGARPVHVYWRMLERGEAEVEELLGIEQPAYGLEDGQQVEATADGWRVHLRLKSFPGRPVDITTSQVRGRCVVQAWTKFGANQAQLEHIFVKTSWPFSVDFVRLDGVGPEGQPVSELIRR
ncbi:DUF4833 domain-containing protein [Myxococcus qinghaiensis]|uniref:DUF4833 domain-containing protein n=1 Tax=Myxococcus qinghaiensis TaxID=2906758 RepID=UPI0020A72972|nr:DUF4833 domain-containing protein [Myxococcus qinghaiensis]MCP3167884.1 DUF4833 domain-containing protein [Myxococcus qinghaiensis]